MRISKRMLIPRITPQPRHNHRVAFWQHGRVSGDNRVARTGTSIIDYYGDSKRRVRSLRPTESGGF
jgi:hypothetical protein